MQKHLWMIRAGEKGIFIDDFINENIVAIGWMEIGDLSNITNKNDLENEIELTYPDWTKGQITNSVGQIYRFLFEIKIGDKVITYNPTTRMYHIGTITGEYEYQPKIIKWLPNIRSVKWENKIFRDRLRVQTKNSLGAIQTLFKPSEEAVSEVFSIISGKTSQIEESDQEKETEEIRRDIIERAHEFIKDKISSLSWEEMQDLVAGILRGMGYKTRISPPGPDRGVDIIASPDGLGLTQPRIFIEVKHRINTQIGSKDIRSLIGGRNPQQDKCLFVSTGGFSKDAKLEAERSHIPLTLLNLDDITNLLIQQYEHLDSETKALIPLVKVYWPS